MRTPKKQAKTKRGGRRVPGGRATPAARSAHKPDVWKAHEVLHSAMLLTDMAEMIGEGQPMDGNGPLAKAWSRAVDACADFYMEAGRFRFSLDDRARLARAGER